MPVYKGRCPNHLVIVGGGGLELATRLDKNLDESVQHN